MLVRRSDTITLDATVKTAEGYLDTHGNLTRTGVFKYLREDGTEQLELRLPEHVFDPASLASFDAQPLTLEHPSELLTADNVMSHAVGFVLGPHKAPDGVHVRARVRVMDAEAVAAVEAGRKELSNGYSTKLVPVPGGVFRRDDFNGGAELRADFLQTDIRGNHTSVVGRGRAGPSARLDSSGNERGIQMDPKDVKIAELEAALATVNAQKADAERVRTEAEKADAARAKAEADRLRGENESLKADVQKRQDAEKATALAQLAARVAPVTKQNTDDLVKLGEEGILRAGLAVMSPELKTDGWNVATLRGAFEVAILGEATRVDSASSAAEILGFVRSTQDAEESSWEINDKKARAVARDAWKTPLGPQPRAGK